ncbi:Uncharacterised protein [Candidatus Bilamarchaeum dharawalense]|uniref:DUF4185 domain-containing protein n=1 Tax=Candidatus Bilamarchaeum dharawalense TaxID=2885759 RepID=A0A5E4LX69_9ARCH|nr:Uncharacterised protein [Candidatus Bilamarchaeum dharawalense]
MNKFFVFVVLVLLGFGCFNKPTDGGQIIINQTQNNQTLPHNETIGIVGEPTYVCELIDDKAHTIGVGGADLGIPVALPSQGNKLWIIFGDVFGASGLGSGGASAVLEAQTPFNCAQTNWKTKVDGKFYQPLTSKRQQGDSSTVPAGAIEINGTLYLYSMRVDHWANKLVPGDETTAHGVLFKEQGDDFVEVISWPVDEKHTNTAPVWGELNGETVIFMAITGKYRESPVYLAYVKPGEIENKNAYHYLTGLGSNNQPSWSTNIADASPIKGMENVKVGEVSLVKNEKYLMMFQSYGGSGGYMLFSADQPYGPYSSPAKFTPCGTILKPASWLQPGWSGCYGGYIFPNNFGVDGKDIYYTISVWRPYTTVVLKMRTG